LALADRRLMIDSGASLHMANWKLLTEAEKLTVRRMIEPICMTTGNGNIWAVNCVDMWIYELDMYIEVCVSPIDDEKGPCVLSLGKLLRLTGGKFRWEGSNLPTIEVNGKTIPCYTSNEVPFMYVLHVAGATPQPQRKPTINNPGGEASSSHFGSAPSVTPPGKQIQKAIRKDKKIKQISAVEELEEKIFHLTNKLKADGLTLREIRIHHLMKSLNEQLSTIRSQPRGTGQLIEKSGDLLEAEKNYLVHQCNCIWKKTAKRLAETVFEHSPEADV
jgi:hypothetical protein